MLNKKFEGGGGTKKKDFLKAISPWKQLGYFLTEKAYPPLRNIAIFPKKCTQKTIIYFSKSLQEPLIKSYDQFKMFTKLEN